MSLNHMLPDADLACSVVKRGMSEVRIGCEPPYPNPPHFVWHGLAVAAGHPHIEPCAQ